MAPPLICCACKIIRHAALHPAHRPSPVSWKRYCTVPFRPRHPWDACIYFIASQHQATHRYSRVAPPPVLPFSALAENRQRTYPVLPARPACGCGPTRRFGPIASANSSVNRQPPELYTRVLPLSSGPRRLQKLHRLSWTGGIESRRFASEMGGASDWIPRPPPPRTSVTSQTAT